MAQVPQGSTIARRAPRLMPPQLHRIGVWAVEAYLRPVAAILMLRSPWLGVGLWIALAMQPTLAAMALLAATLSEGLGRVMERYLPGRFGLAERMNNLLVGLVSAWLLLPLGQPILLIIAFIVMAQMLAMLVALVIARVFDPRGLPVLILPYATVAVLLFTLMPLAIHNSVLVFGWPPLQSPTWADVPLTFVQAMGVVVLSPSALAGSLVLLVIFANAPLTFVAGMLGWLGGMLVAQAFLMLGIRFAWEVTAYNFVLAGMAAGSAFFVPSRGSLVLAPFAGALAAVVAAFIQNIITVPGLSILPIPFGMTALVLFSAFTAGPLLPDPDWQSTPALKWMRSSWLMRRWGLPEAPLLAVPLSGPVRVTQGFDGPISHRAQWRHALDFERPERGDQLAQSLWAEQVRAPVKGRVVELCNDVPDNPPGIANHAENWGNHLLIQHDANYHVLLAHLLPGSISVAPGQNVGFATRVGQVGNSGRSYVPHLHMHAQRTGVVGAATMPFRLANYLELDPASVLARRWQCQGLPREGDLIAAAVAVPAVHDTLSSILPGETIWTLEVEGEPPSWVTLRQPVVSTTAITSAGACRISCGGDHLLARFDVDGWRIIDLRAEPGSLVATLAAAMATVPWCAVPGLEWDDILPRAWPRRLEKPVEALLPFASARLQRLGLRCVKIPDAVDQGLKLRAVPQGSGPYGASDCQVTIEAQRGPVAAVWGGPGCRLTYTAMSFEVAQG